MEFFSIPTGKNFKSLIFVFLKLSLSSNPIAFKARQMHLMNISQNIFSRLNDNGEYRIHKMTIVSETIRGSILKETVRSKTLVTGSESEE